MSFPSFPTLTEQVSAYLREELLRGRWSGEIPGQKQLAKLLGVSAQTVEPALGALEKDNFRQIYTSSNITLIHYPRTDPSAPTTW